MQIDKVTKAIQEVHEEYKARGNFGHSGRPGKVGGSVASSRLSSVPSANVVPSKINGVPLTDDAKQTYTKIIKKYTAKKWFDKLQSRLYNRAGGRKQITGDDVNEAHDYVQKLIQESK